MYFYHQGTLEDRLIRQIVTGDSLLYQSILIFINQDITSYIKGGWCLRKAWKLYEKTLKEITQIHERAKKREGNPNPCTTNHSAHIVVVPEGIPNGGETPTRGSRSSSFGSDSGSLDGKDVVDLPLTTSTRLVGSVSFGYGILKLVVSLVPPKILKLIEFLGFDGDRPSGLIHLDLASKTRDMKAPLAM